MANKKINELVTRTPSLTDLMLVGDPSSGYSYKCTITSLATIIETDIADGYVTLGTTQTITGAKTFSNNLTLTSVSNAGVDTDKFLVLNGSNVVNFRTGSEVLSDIGGQGALTLTTTGTSGAATLVGNTLNIPQYQAALTNPVTGTGTTNYIPRFSSSSAIDNSIMRQSGTSIGINTSPAYILDVFDGQSASIGVGTSTNKLVLVANDTSVSLQTTNDAFITFAPQQVAAMRITSGGIVNMGANFANNFNKLNVGGSATIGYTTTVVAPNDGLSVNGSVGIGFSGASTAQKLSVNGDVSIATIANATTDTDRFLVSDSGVIKYRTGAEVLSDIGGQAALTNPITGTGLITQAAFFTGTNTIAGSSVLVLDGSNIAIGQAAAAQKLSVNGDVSIATINNATTDTDKFLVSDGGVIKYRTGSEVLSDIGAAASTSISGTTNYIPKFTSSSAIGNSTMQESSGSFLAGSATASGSGLLTIAIGNTIGGAIRAQDTDGGGTIEMQASGGLTYIGSTSNHNVSFMANNSQLMLLNTSGNLGLGVTPSAWGSAFRAFQILNQASISAEADLLASSVNAFYDGTNWKYIANGFATNYYQNNGQHIWRYAGSGTAGNAISFTQAMTLDASGNLGIGITSPTSYNSLADNLVIGGSGTNGITIVSGTSSFGTLFFADGTTGNQQFRGFLQYNHTSDALEFGTSGVNAMTLDASGNLLIGTTTLRNRLTLRASDAPTSPILGTASGHAIFGNGASNVDYGLMIGVNGDGNSWLQSQRVDGTATAYNILLNPSGGNVGIGTTLPLGKLHSASTTSDYAIVADNTLTGTQNFILFRAGANIGDINRPNGTNDVRLNSNFGSIVFGTDGSGTAAERMRITSGGLVGIGTGTTSPDTKLQVQDGYISTYHNANVNDAGYGVEFYTNGGGSRNTIAAIYPSQVGTSRSGNLYFLTSNGGAPTEKMRITSGGNVGIGTGSTVLTPGGSRRGLQIGNGTNGALIAMGADASESNNPRIFSNQYDLGFAAGITTGVMDFYTNDVLRMRITSVGDLLLKGASTTTNAEAVFQNTNTATSIYASQSGSVTKDITFHSGGTAALERMRITSGGNVLIGTTTDAGQKLQVNGDITGTNLILTGSVNIGNGSVLSSGGSAGTIYVYAGATYPGGTIESNGGLASTNAGTLLFRSGTGTGTQTERMRITAGGEVYIGNNPADQGAYNLQVNGTGVWGAGAYVNGSDIALKENIFDLDGCLDLVKQLKPVTYKYKQSYSRDTSTQTGFIAQDLKELFKDKSYLGGLVKEGGQHLSVAYQNLIPLLVKAIQEQQAEIEILKNK